MAETGLSLVVSKEMLANLQKADNAITNLATKSEQAKNRIVNAFTEMGQKGVGAFIRKLNEAQKALTGFDSVMGNIKSNNLAAIGSQATNSIDDVNKLIQALSRLNDSQTNSVIAKATEADYKKLANTIKEVKVVEDERNRELTRKNKENIANNKIYAEQLKTNTNLAISKEKERQIQIKRSLDELKRLAKAYKAMPQTISTKQVGNLVAGSVQSTSINQRLVAIHNLQKAIKDLDTTDKRYNSTLNKLNSEIERQKQELGKLGVNIDKVSKSHKGLLDISGQLQRRLALIFSVSQITGYVNKLIQVRGEFELQQRSLQALLQNKDEANKLWQQTIDLAIRSPFRVKELVTYTKQLAAYRVETEKLHDTTKMLADISSGLGVDMQRLILAYGQVKAANYLRGTELRQFSEAGVNILGELATYFSELENRAVSVGDVFERVSKRMVAFSDVEAIFKRLTSEGGTFYRMQEIQSETLKGLISNLKDSIDLMLNEIGASNEGTLKSMVGLIKSLVDNWRFFAVTLKQVAIIMSGMGIAKFVSGWKLVATQGAAAALAMNGMAGAGARLNVALATIGKTINKHPIFLFIAALASVGHYFIEYVKSIKHTNSAYDEMSDRIYRSRDALNELNNKIQDNNKSIKEYTDLIANNDSSTKEYEKAKKSLNNAEKTSSLLYDELKKKYPDIIKFVKKQKDGIIDLTEAVALYNRIVTTQIALNEQAKGGIGYESAKKNYEDLLDRQANINSLVTKVKSTTASAITQLDRFKNEMPKDVFNKIYELANNVLNASSDNIIDIRADLMLYLQTIKDEVPKANDIINAFIGSWKKFDVYALSKQLGNYTGDWENFVANLKNMKPAFEDAIRGLSFETGEDKAMAGSLFNALLDNLGIFDEKVRKATQDWLELELALQGKIDWSSKGFATITDNETINNEEELSSLLSDRISVIKELNSSYKELNKTFDETESKEKVMDSYLNTVNSLFSDLGITIKDIDFTSIDGVISALKRLLPTVQEGTKDWIRLNRAISEFNIEKDVDLRISENKNFLDQIEEMFSGYEVSLELQKLNIPPDLAKQLFNFDTLTLPQLKENVLRLRPEFEGKDMLDEWNKLMKRINDIETKAQEERLKTYTKYLLKAQSERVKIKLEELRQLEEVEKESAYSPEQKSVIKQAIKDETQGKIDKQIWEDFKNTTLYIQMFDELEYVSTNALKKMRSELLNMRDSLKNLEPSELKEIQDRLTAIGDEIVDRNPFEGLSASLKDGIKALKTLDEQQERFNEAQAKEDKAKELVDTLQLQVAETKKRNAEFKSSSAFNKVTEAILDSQLKTQEKQLEVAIEEYAVAKGITKEEAKQLLLQQQQISEANKKLNKVGSNGSDITGMANDVISALDNWGVEVSEEFTQILGGVGKTFDSLAEIDLTKPMSIIKAVVGVLVGISDTIAGIFVGTNDAKRERQIQKELKLVEDLEKSYEKLEKAIENAYDVDTLKKAFDNANKNIDQEIASLEKAIKLEEDKKKTDSDRIKEWEERIDELQEKRKELLKEQVENLGGGYDFDSITEEFVNAWLDAFKETGNGLSGLEENFAEFWQNVAIKQAVMGGASKILEPFLNEVNKALENDFTITDSEMANIDALGEDAKAKLDAFLEQWYSRWGDMIGDTEQGELSGLQRGIQELSESTGQELAAYLNSIRFFVADTNTKLSQFVDAFFNTDSVNPMLSQLRIIAQQTTAIHTLLDSLTTPHPTLSGRGLKVVL